MLDFYDPPHLPAAAATQASLKQYVTDYGLDQTCKGDNVAALHLPFLAEAKRVLRPDGLIFAKIKDYIHNHRYQWNIEYFNAAVRAVGISRVADGRRHTTPRTAPAIGWWSGMGVANHAQFLPRTWRS